MAGDHPTAGRKDERARVFCYVRRSVERLKEGRALMPRQKSLVTVIRDMVRQEVSGAMQALLSFGSGPKRKSKNGRRKRRRGPGRPKGSKNKTA